jgi:hypothetical protein
MRWSVMLLGLVLLSCADRPPTRGPDITGQITRVRYEIIHVTARVIILVEAVPSDTSGSAKALVTVDGSTRLFRANADAAVRVEDLLTGTTVSVWFDGPVAESYPSQAKAGALFIHTDARPGPLPAPSRAPTP